MKNTVFYPHDFQKIPKIEDDGPAVPSGRKGVHESLYSLQESYTVVLLQRGSDRPS